VSATPKPGMLTAEEVRSYAEPVMAYRNLHFRTEVVYSVKDRRKNRLIAYTADLTLVDVTFVIRDSERRRAVLHHQRNVHAFAVGTIVAADPTPDELWIPATYHPFKYETFVDSLTEQPIFSASAVHLGPAGMHYRP
jgi:hypothetical protein